MRNGLPTGEELWSIEVPYLVKGTVCGGPEAHVSLVLSTIVTLLLLMGGIVP